jgi:hypothetical protein
MIEKSNSEEAGWIKLSAGVSVNFLVGKSTYQVDLGKLELRLVRTYCTVNARVTNGRKAAAMSLGKSVSKLQRRSLSKRHPPRFRLAYNTIAPTYHYLICNRPATSDVHVQWRNSSIHWEVFIISLPTFPAQPWIAQWLLHIFKGISFSTPSFLLIKYVSWYISNHKSTNLQRRISTN